MWNAARRAGLAIVLAGLGGCASIVGGTNQSLSVTAASEAGDVAGANCRLENDKGSWFATTPGSVVVRRSKQDLIVTCTHAEHEPGQQAARSTTKGMVAGNALFGGVIGVGVDISTGAAFDYPNVIVVSMVRNAKAGAAGAVAAPAPVPPKPAEGIAMATLFRPGTQLVFSDTDPVSGALLGESLLTVSDASDRQRIYAAGTVAVGIDGTPVRGNEHGITLFGVAPRDLNRPGAIVYATFRTSGLGDTKATVTIGTRQPKVISGQRFEATRVRFEGYASRELLVGQSSLNGAFFEGDALIDNASGLILELRATSRFIYYNVKRELVRVALAP